MSEHDNLQDADGDNLNATPQEKSTTEATLSLLKKLPSEEVLASETPTEESSSKP